MRAKKVLFIIPALPEVRVTLELPVLHKKLFNLPYLGVMNLAAVTPRDYEVRIVNEHLTHVDFDEAADLVGITVMTPLAPRAYEISAEFRRRGIPVILGGLHPTVLPEEAKHHCDAVVRGEAEKTWPLVLKDFEQNALKPVYEKQPPFDLAELPLPRRELVAGDRNPYDVVQVTRGCIFRCEFCSVHHFHDHTFRTRPVEHVIAELEMLNGRIVFFVDDNISADKEWAKRLFRAMIPLRKKWVSMASLTIACDDELLRLARASGCLGFFVGLESLDPDNLRDANKEHNQCIDYRAAIRRMQHFGLGVSAGTVYGFDHDDKTVFARTLAFARENNLCMLQVSPLVPFPGTVVYEKFRREGRALDPDWSKYDFYNVTFEPKQMSKEELLKGMEWVRARYYSWPSILKRVSANAPDLGAYSTVFNLFLNWSVRDNQRKGYHYPP
jgi:radical SAM superfamily enzyme YgiQ (UPF0313 family)